MPFRFFPGFSWIQRLEDRVLKEMLENRARRGLKRLSQSESLLLSCRCGAWFGGSSFGTSEGSSP